MFKVNEDYLKLPGSYLFSTIGKESSMHFQEENPDKNIIRLGIGDVTQPLAPAIIDSAAQCSRRDGTMQRPSMAMHRIWDMNF